MTTTFYYGEDINNLGNGTFLQIFGEMTSESYGTIPDDFTFVDIGSDVTSLGNSCFRYLESLKSVTIPSSVISLGDFCFNLCTSLETITIPSSVISLGVSCFMGCNALTTIDIPFGVTSFGESCFNTCYTLTTMIIPSSVNSLGDYCFNNCTGLITIDIPPFVTSLGKSCFSGCYNLTTIYIPPSITSLTESCFESCIAFTAITIPQNITSLGPSCFRYCGNLKTITIPSNVISLGESCFFGCSTLTTIIFEVGTSQIDISGGIFKYAYENESISQTVIFYNASSYANLTDTGLGPLVDASGDYFIISPASPPPSFVYLPSTNTLASYNDGTYQYTENENYYNDISNNFTSIILGSNVTTIGPGSLQNSNATSFILPSNITTMEPGAFQNSALVTADLSTAITIGTGVLQGSLNLVSLLMSGNLPIPDYTCYECPKLSSYSDATAAPTFLTSLTPMPIPMTFPMTFSMPIPMTFSMPIPMTIISTSFGEFYDTIITAIFKNPTIGKSAFSGTGIVEVIILSSVTSIGDDCFSSTLSLNTIVFEDGRKRINFGNKLFWNISSSVTVKFYNASSYFDLSIEFRKLVNDVTKRSYKYFNTPNVTFLYMSVKVPISIPVLRVSGLSDFYNNKSKKVTNKRIKQNLSKNFSK
jgi:hypothetical protein